EGSRPVYTAPPVFLELEEDYKRQKQQAKKAKAKGKRIDDDDELDELASDLDDSGYLSTGVNNRHAKKNKSKKQKVAVKRKEGKKSVAIKGPSPFDNLSIEFLLHIFSFVPHEQLFYLTNLSRRFHNALKSKHLRKTINEMWRAARERVKPELPRLSDMREREFAHLLYAKQCFFCEKDEGEGDPFVRIVMCKPCRKQNLVNVEKVSAEFPEVMHGAAECCISTCHRVFKTDLEDESEELYKRERRDLDAFEADQWNAIDAGKGSNAKSLYVPEFETKVPKEGTGKRVIKYVEKRKKEGRALWNWMEDRKDESKKKQEEAVDQRRKAIEVRVLALDGYTEEDFDDHWKKSALITNGPSEIDDAAWNKLEPKVVKVIESGRKLRDKALGQARFAGRLAHLRGSIYDRLLESHGDASTFPLFADFCLLPSVVALFDPDDTTSGRISKRKWAELRAAVVEETNAWFDSTRLAVIKLVLTRTLTLEPDEELSDDPRAFDPFVDDATWLDELVQSCVCCDVRACRPGSFGSLSDVLAHQHAAHSDLAPDFRESRQPPIRFALPVAVASAVSDLVGLAGLEADSARVRDVDAQLDGLAVQWENAPRAGYGKSKRESDWRKIVRLPSFSLSGRAPLTPPRQRV
ncbi:hypothetical protein JCM11491_001623, partial [Sporobolomyces phaffii]